MENYRWGLQPVPHLGQEYRRKTFFSVLIVRSQETVDRARSDQRTSLGDTDCGDQGLGSSGAHHLVSDIRKAFG